MRKIPSRLRIAAVVAVAAVAVTACGGGRINTSTPTTTKSSDPTTTLDPQATQRAAVVDSYRHYLDVYFHAHESSNADDPALAQVLTGAALFQQRLDLSGLRSAGEVMKVTDVSSRPTIISLEPTRAVIDDCLFGAPHYYDINTGAVRGTVPSGPSGDGVEYVLLLESGSWKVSEKNQKDAVCHT